MFSGCSSDFTCVRLNNVYDLEGSVCMNRTGMSLLTVIIVVKKEYGFSEGFPI